MSLIDTITDIIEGIKALPACAKAVRELAAAWQCDPYQDQGMY